MALSNVQRDWLDVLAEIVGDAPNTPEEDGADARTAARLRSGDQAPVAGAADGPVAVGFVPELLSWGPAVLKILSNVGPGQCTCAIQVHNKTNLRIFRGDIRPGKQVLKLPQDSIEPGKHAEFVMGGPPPLIPGSSIPIEGCVGEMDWIITGDVNFTIKWDNPILGNITSDASLSDVGSASAFSVDKINTNKHQAEFKFTIFGGSSPNPNPNPNPNPSPSADITSSCLIQVFNGTQQKLTLMAAKHERGDFMVRPQPELQPSAGDDAIVSIETPRSDEQGCKGFLEYAIGEPPTGTWRVEWDNPEGQKNTADSTISPDSPTFNSLALISQGDENVRVNFTLRQTGGQAPTPPGPVPPGPVPPVPTPPEPIPPTPVPPAPPPGKLPKTRQPTLRVGDKSPDGWVEYLQERLNDLIDAGLTVDGGFGKATLAAVHKFQLARGLQNDGTVGNQTWAALRDAAPEGPSTDGRKPHSFVQKGPQARWNDEKERAIYLPQFDEMLLFLVSVGTEPIDSFSVDVTVTAPGMAASTQSFPIGAADKTPKSGGGSFHSLKMPGFRARFPSKDPAALITSYQIEAVLPKALGGEGWTGAIVVAP